MVRGGGVGGGALSTAVEEYAHVSCLPPSLSQYVGAFRIARCCYVEDGKACLSSLCACCHLYRIELAHPLSQRESRRTHESVHRNLCVLSIECVSMMQWR